MFVGIDLTAGGRPTAAAALSADLQSHELAMLDSDADLLEFAGSHQAHIVAIDAPLGLPLGQCCLEPECACRPQGDRGGRECERALSRLGIGCYYTTKRSIIKAMVYRGMRLKTMLENEGVTVLEVYPYATKVRLLGKPLPRKSTALGRTHAEAALSKLLGKPTGCLTHDLADALFCAYTARLYGNGQTEALGDPDEGLLYIPAVRT